MRLKFDPDPLLSNLLLYLILAGYIATVYTITLSVVIASGIVPFDAARIMFSPPWWVNVIVIIIVSIFFLPLRRWLQSRINMLIYGEHDDPYTLISQVNRQLQRMMSPQITLRGAVEMIALTLKLPYVSIENLNRDSPLKVEFGVYPPRLRLTSFPLTYLDKAIGELHVGARRTNEILSNSDENLLRDVARQVGIALYAAELTDDLQRARERLVLAREEERRRIRNDLHDGLAPTLSSILLQLGAVRNVMRQDLDQADGMINEARDDLRNATAEIRQLIYDLRPPMLDELGLVGAIKNFRLLGSEIDFQVNAPESLPRLPAAVEVAVYRIVSEAVYNVIKHAQATCCVVEIRLGTDRLELRVSDNGTSLAPEHTVGVGFSSMRERVAELGGTLAIQSCEDSGTCVIAQFPLEL